MLQLVLYVLLDMQTVIEQVQNALLAVQELLLPHQVVRAVLNVRQVHLCQKMLRTLALVVLKVRFLLQVLQNVHRVQQEHLIKQQEELNALIVLMVHLVMMVQKHVLNVVRDTTHPEDYLPASHVNQDRILQLQDAVSVHFVPQELFRLNQRV